MNLKSELKTLKKRHSQYSPVLGRMLEMYGTYRDRALHLEDDEDVFLILELLDLGYLDKQAFAVHRSFNEIDSLIYSGTYPLTEAGQAVLNESTKPVSGSAAPFVFLAACAAALIIYMLFFRS